MRFMAFAIATFVAVLMATDQVLTQGRYSAVVLGFIFP